MHLKLIKIFNDILAMEFIFILEFFMEIKWKNLASSEALFSKKFKLYKIYWTLRVYFVIEKQSC